MGRSEQLKRTTEERKVSRDRSNPNSGLITKAGGEVKSLRNSEGRNEAVVWYMDASAGWQ